ncbi:MAG: hypothetical protein Q4D27_09050 [Coriobacteriia bacterium]|nr:hypothetical protein [Coriobacteriia bacterium]
MKETLSIKKMQMSVVAVVMAAVVALGMGAFAQQAYAEDAVALGKTASVTYKNVKFTFKNKSLKTEGVTLVKVKELKSVSKITVPNTVKLNGHVYKVYSIDAKAFKGTKAKTIVLQANAKSKLSKIKANAFKGSKATKLIIKNKKLVKSNVAKNWLKGSKIKTVKAPSAKVKLFKSLSKKAYSGKASVKVTK